MRKFLQLLLVACLAVIVPFTLIWAHRMFVTGLNPSIGAIFALLTVLIGVLLTVRIIYVLVKRRSQKLAYSPSILFAVGSVCCLFAAVLEAGVYGNSTLDLQVHDTYFVIEYSYAMKAVAIPFGLFSAIYYWYPRWFGRPLNATLSYIHFWVTFVGAYLIFWPVSYHDLEGIAGMPRSYLDYGIVPALQGVGWADWLMLIAVIGLILAQLLFLFNFFYSLVRPVRARGSL